MKKLYLIILVTLTLAGCAKTQPVYNVSEHAVPANVESSKVQDSIIDALKYKRWTIEEKKPGEVVANIYVRSHQARIRITYDTQNYNIEYVDSSNLKYSEQKNTIHRNYNKWIQLLEQEIDTRLNNLQY
ncbi:putative periplasmic lipoprotein [Thalassotalea litorea]|uniref:hypothetical protein n=1 Tax=Thalassotalea litorea TaxID=2020715 RepID=UPI003735ECFC